MHYAQECVWATNSDKNIKQTLVWSVCMCLCVFVCICLVASEHLCPLAKQAEREEKYAARQEFRTAADLAYEQGLRIFPQDENLLLRRAQVLDRLRRFDEAEASYLAAIAADPRLTVLQDFYRKHRKFRAASEPEPSP